MPSGMRHASSPPSAPRRTRQTPAKSSRGISPRPAAQPPQRRVRAPSLSILSIRCRVVGRSHTAKNARARRSSRGRMPRRTYKAFDQDQALLQNGGAFRAEDPQRREQLTLKATPLIQTVSRTGSRLLVCRGCRNPLIPKGRPPYPGSAFPQKPGSGENPPRSFARGFVV